MTVDYAAIKLVHAGAAALSIGLFALRGAWMLRSPHWLQRPRPASTRTPTVSSARAYDLINAKCSSSTTG